MLQYFLRYLKCKNSKNGCLGTAQMDIMQNGELGDLKHFHPHSRLCVKDPLAEQKAAFLNDLKEYLSRQFWKLKEIYEYVAQL